MFLRLTDLDNNLQLINIQPIDGICLGQTKHGEVFTKICFESGIYFAAKETVSEISLLLQKAGKVI